jgi:hypothetical protein
MGTLFRPQVILIAVIAAVAALGGSPALAQSEDTISATVTPGLIAARVGDGSVAYGTVNLGDKKNTVVGDAEGGAAETQTVFNDGTISANLLLGSGDATGTVTWELIACASAGSETFGHQYEVNNIDTTFNPTDFPADNSNADTTVDLTAGDGNDTSGTDQADLDLGICMPASTADSSEHSITVTALLTEA